MTDVDNDVGASDVILSATSMNKINVRRTACYQNAAVKFRILFQLTKVQVLE